MIKRLLKAVGALLLLTTFLIGVPVGLCVAVGWPLPTTLPTLDGVSDFLTQNGVPDDVLIDGLAIALWLLWVAFALTVVGEVMAAFRGGNSRRFIGGPMQVAAASLVATIVFALPTGGRSISTPPVSLAVITQTIDPVQLAAASTAVAPVMVTADKPALPTYTVVRHDTLWDIAEQYLGNAQRWREIFTLNQGVSQSDGRALVNGDRIYPGWQLQLPADATIARTASLDPVESVPSVSAEEPTSPDTAVDGPDEVVEDDVAPTTTTSIPVEVEDEKPSAEPDVDAPVDGGSSVILTSGGLIGSVVASGIGAALVAARLRRRRLYVPSTPTSDIVIEDPLAPELVRKLRSVDLLHKASIDQPDDVFPARRLEPGRVVLGVKDFADVEIDLTATGGLSVRGDASEDVIRALVIGFISNCNAIDAEVVFGGEDVARHLFGEVDGFPGFRIATDLADALRTVEVDMLTRNRLLDDAGLSDISALRSASPIEEVPAKLIVMSGADDALQRRAEAVATAGVSLGIGVLSIGGEARHLLQVQDGVVASDSTLLLPGVTGSTLFRLTVADAAQLLTVLRAARVDVDPRDLAPKTVEFVTPVIARQRDEVQPVIQVDTVPDVVVAVPVIDDQVAPVSLVYFEFFGAPRLLVNGKESKQSLRNQLMQAAALMALHPRGLTLEEVGVAFWPDLDAYRMGQRVRSLCANVNIELRVITEASGLDFVERVNGRYRLNAELVGCDVWTVEQNLAKYSPSIPQHDVLAAAVAAYGGVFASGADWQWAELFREDFRRRMLSTMAALAESLQGREQYADAAAILENAIEVDPCGEEMHRRLMRAHVALGHPDAARRVYKRLEHQLVQELGIDPSDETTQLYDSL